MFLLFGTDAIILMEGPIQRMIFPEKQRLVILQCPMKEWIIFV